MVATLEHVVKARNLIRPPEVADSELIGSPASFWPVALPYAQQVHAAIPSLYVSFLLAQFGDETGFGGWDWYGAHNPGNVGSYDGQPVNVFPNLEVGIAAYEQTIRLGYYNAVRAAANTWAQCVALGLSPWASGRYNGSGGGPGSDLILIIRANNLTQYDGGAPTPPVPVPPTQIFKPLDGRFGVLNKPVVAVVPTPSGNGYWEIGADGGTFNYGDAPFLGSLANVKLNAPIVDADCTPTGKGLTLLATDGGIFDLGDSLFEGSEGGHALNAPCVSVRSTKTGRGYWIAAADGGVFNFGDASFHGSAA